MKYFLCDTKVGGGGQPQVNYSKPAPGTLKAEYSKVEGESMGGGAAKKTSTVEKTAAQLAKDDIY
jgi:hypothetical protein